jgi:hypothetical protein
VLLIPAIANARTVSTHFMTTAETAKKKLKMVLLIDDKKYVIY